MSSILIVSLLRLGDLIQHKIIIQNIKLKYPEAKFSLLAFSEFSTAAFLFEGLVDEFYWLDRNLLSKESKTIHFNESIFLLKHLPELFKKNINFVFNLTHSRFSAVVAGLFWEAEKKGLYYEDSEFKGFNNPWMRYLNDAFSSGGKSVFTYIEVLNASLGLTAISTHSIKKQHSFKTYLKTRIGIQLFTSQDKKNWSLDRFVDIGLMLEKNLGFEVVFFCSPTEKNKINFDSEKFKNIKLLVYDLKKLYDYMQSLRLLITGDTSIKHLAAELNIPIVELILGSSDILKHSAWTTEKTIVNPAVVCQPCDARTQCFQSTHLCSDKLTTDQVYQAVQDLLQGKFSKIHDGDKVNQYIWKMYLNNSSSQENLFEKTHLDLELLKNIKYKNELLMDRVCLFRKQVLDVKSNTKSMIELQNFLKNISNLDDGFFSNRLNSYYLANKSNPNFSIEKVEQGLLEMLHLLNLKNNFLKEGNTDHGFRGEDFRSFIKN